MKYVLPSHSAVKKSKNHSHRKPGYCFSEEKYVELIRQETGVGTSRHPLVYLVEAADDCVYSICDLEDGVKKGIISFSEMGEHLEKAAKEIAKEEAEQSGASAKDSNELGENAAALLKRLKENALARVNTGAESGPSLSGTAREDAYMQMFRVLAIGTIVNSACDAFIKNYDLIMGGHFEGDLIESDNSWAARTIVKAAKTLGRKRIYCTRPTLELELRGGHIICSLLDLLWKGIDPVQRITPTGEAIFRFDLPQLSRCHGI